MTNLITSFIDVFYRPFRKVLPLQTFRYAACGGGNTLLGLVIYTICYKFVFRQNVLDLGFYALEPHSASLLVSFLINFPVGFILMKYVVFIGSNLRGRIQLFRYFFVFVTNLFLNYIMLKVLVEYVHLNAILAQVISTAVVIGTSYILQRHFSFKTEQESTEID